MGGVRDRMDQQTSTNFSSSAQHIQFPDMNYLGSDLGYRQYSGQEERQDQEEGGQGGQGGHHYTNNYYDCEEVERFRLERKRERNRIAATKCRQRKLEKIAQLDSEVSQLKEENLTLKKVREKLREEAQELRRRLRLHVDGGCVVHQ